MDKRTQSSHRSHSRNSIAADIGTANILGSDALRTLSVNKFENTRNRRAGCPSRCGKVDGSDAGPSAGIPRRPAEPPRRITSDTAHCDQEWPARPMSVVSQAWPYRANAWSPARIVPKAGKNNSTPTANLKELFNRPAMGSWKVFPSSTTRWAAAAAPAVTGKSRPDPPAPSATTTDTASTPSKITTFNALVVAIPLKPRSHLSALAVL